MLNLNSFRCCSRKQMHNTQYSIHSAVEKNYKFSRFRFFLLVGKKRVDF